MIIHSLCEYYERISQKEEADIPLFGFSKEKINFCFVLGKSGRLLNVIPLHQQEGRKVIPKLLSVPVDPYAKRTGSLPKAVNFLWDNSKYVLGAATEGTNEKLQACFQSFRDFHRQFEDKVPDDGFKALTQFLAQWDPQKIGSFAWRGDVAGRNIVFQLDGDRGYIHQRSALKEAWGDYCGKKSSDIQASCLVTGRISGIARLHKDIKGVRGAQSKGASIVSFNLEAFESYGKKQNFNAPIGENSAFAYTTALNYLLRFESRQKVQIGDATTVFWTSRDSPIEGFMGYILNPIDNEADTGDVRLFLEAARDGSKPRDIDEAVRFCVLGLSPNAGRLSVRFWYASEVADIKEKLGQHFRDLQLKRDFPDKQLEFPGMWHLLRETSVQGKTENISPLLAGTFTRAILTGGMYPEAILSALIERIRADRHIGYYRVAMIKAYINRRWRLSKSQQKEVGMVLDRQRQDVPYLLGRLFAVLEKAQTDAVPGAGSTIRDRFYGSASSTPGVAFPLLMKLAQHHISKSKFGVHLDKMIQETMEGIKIFPAYLDLEGQGLFAIGYYHQKQDIYKSKEEKEA